MGKQTEPIPSGIIEQFDLPNLGNLKRLVIGSPSWIDEEGRKRAGVDDQGQSLRDRKKVAGFPHNVAGFAEASTGTVYVSPIENIMVLVHELCHMTGTMTPKQCDDLLPSDKYENWPDVNGRH